MVGGSNLQVIHEGLEWRSFVTADGERGWSCARRKETSARRWLGQADVLAQKRPGLRTDQPQERVAGLG